MGQTLWRVNLSLFKRDAVFWDVGSGFCRFRQRTDPLGVIELLRGRVFSFKNISCVEQEAAPFRQGCCRPLDVDKETSPLAGFFEKDDGIPGVPAVRQLGQERSWWTV